MSPAVTISTQQGVRSLSETEQNFDRETQALLDRRAYPSPPPELCAQCAVIIAPWPVCEHEGRSFCSAGCAHLGTCQTCKRGVMQCLCFTCEFCGGKPHECKCGEKLNSQLREAELEVNSLRDELDRAEMELSDAQERFKSWKSNQPPSKASA